MNVTGKHNPYQAKGHGVYELLTFYVMRVHTSRQVPEGELEWNCGGLSSLWAAASHLLNIKITELSVIYKLWNQVNSNQVRLLIGDNFQ